VISPNGNKILVAARITATNFWLILPSGEKPQGAYCVFTAETKVTPLPLVCV
jgi:hypothetical protein